MYLDELIKELTAIAEANGNLRVKFRQANGYLSLPDEITVERNSFETWAEIG